MLKKGQGQDSLKALTEVGKGRSHGELWQKLMLQNRTHVLHSSPLLSYSEL